MKQAILQLETLSCPTCMQKIEQAAKRVPGVDQKSIKVMFNASKLKLSYDESKSSLEDLKQAIVAVGYDVLKATEK